MLLKNSSIGAIVSQSRSGDALRIRNGGTNSTIFDQLNDTTFSVNNSTDTGVFLITPNATISSTTTYIAGSVGIACTAPTVALDVAGTITTSANVHITGAIKDSSGDYGTSGQVLSSTGTTIEWANPSFSDHSVENFVDGVDYTSGITTQLTLASNPGVEENTQVYFDGVYQEKNNYTLSAGVITFGSAIPTGVNAVEVVYGQAADVLASSIRQIQLGDVIVTGKQK